MQCLAFFRCEVDSQTHRLLHKHMCIQPGCIYIYIYLYKYIYVYIYAYTRLVWVSPGACAVVNPACNPKVYECTHASSAGVDIWHWPWGHGCIYTHWILDHWNLMFRSFMQCSFMQCYISDTGELYNVWKYNHQLLICLYICIFMYIGDLSSVSKKHIVCFRPLSVFVCLDPNLVVVYIWFVYLGVLQWPSVFICFS